MLMKGRDDDNTKGTLLRVEDTDVSDEQAIETRHVRHHVLVLWRLVLGGILGLRRHILH